MGKTGKQKMNFKTSNIIISIMILMFLASNTPASTEKYRDELKKYVNSGYVDYKSWSKDHEGLNEFMRSLETVDLDSLSDKEARALLINAYNAGMIWLILKNYPVEGVFDIKPKVFEQKTINIGGEMLSLDEIENDYLRKMGDNRIHFAIVCGSNGCPDLPSEMYDAETLENRLDDKARKYLSQPKGMVIEKENGVVQLSMIFNWFGSDFGNTPAEILVALSPYLPDEKAEYIRENSKKVMVRFIDYDWTLNGD
jgi:hypothetical protein